MFFSKERHQCVLFATIFFIIISLLQFCDDVVVHWEGSKCVSRNVNGRILYEGKSSTLAKEIPNYSSRSFNIPSFAEIKVKDHQDKIEEDEDHEAKWGSRVFSSGDDYYQNCDETGKNTNFFKKLYRSMKNLLGFVSYDTNWCLEFEELKKFYGDLAYMMQNNMSVDKTQVCLIDTGIDVKDKLIRHFLKAYNVGYEGSDEPANPDELIENSEWNRYIHVQDILSSSFRNGKDIQYDAISTEMCNSRNYSNCESKDVDDIDNHGTFLANTVIRGDLLREKKVYRKTTELFICKAFGDKKKLNSHLVPLVKCLEYCRDRNVKIIHVSYNVQVKSEKLIQVMEDLRRANIIVVSPSQQVYDTPSMRRTMGESEVAESGKSNVAKSGKSDVGESSKSDVGESSKSDVGESSKSNVGESSKSDVGESSKSDVGESSKSDVGESSKSDVEEHREEFDAGKLYPSSFAGNFENVFSVGALKNPPRGEGPVVEINTNSFDNQTERKISRTTGNITQVQSYNKENTTLFNFGYNKRSIFQKYSSPMRKDERGYASANFVNTLVVMLNINPKLSMRGIRKILKKSLVQRSELKGLSAWGGYVNLFKVIEDTLRERKKIYETFFQELNTDDDENGSDEEEVKTSHIKGSAQKSALQRLEDVEVHLEDRTERQHIQEERSYDNLITEKVILNFDEEFNKGKKETDEEEKERILASTLEEQKFFTPLDDEKEKIHTDSGNKLLNFSYANEETIEFEGEEELMNYDMDSFFKDEEEVVFPKEDDYPNDITHYSDYNDGEYIYNLDQLKKYIYKDEREGIIQDEWSRHRLTTPLSFISLLDTSHNDETNLTFSMNENEKSNRFDEHFPHPKRRIYEKSRFTEAQEQQDVRKLNGETSDDSDYDHTDVVTTHREHDNENGKEDYYKNGTLYNTDRLYRNLSEDVPSVNLLHTYEDFPPAVLPRWEKRGEESPWGSEEGMHDFFTTLDSDRRGNYRANRKEDRPRRQEGGHEMQGRPRRYETRRRPRRDVIGRRPHGDVIGKRPHGDVIGKRPHGDVIGKRPHSDVIGRRPRRDEPKKKQGLDKQSVEMRKKSTLPSSRRLVRRESERSQNNRENENYRLNNIIKGERNKRHRNISTSGRPVRTVMPRIPRRIIGKKT
ncbi:hypothetical protein, conserved [Plasmodium gonderi]|uniref:subtilisin n=1 Tax=Plasmodium gonderi TaxID=77519 RepID=A0A1Y1JL08_PLAGO|nr:hypothetical protein, conserved [Plasmodium gonderi]GAW81482.1 hypothetical protein, conserved [Plasmodium gonderi]